ncbi:MAG: carbonic anhydrase [Rhodobacteraceae bacterium]|nr:carbonic anhydrase [Paracoccaceae bacterium]
MEQFLEGYRRFRADYFERNKDMLKSLMAKGQSPKAMMIACSDSRIDPGLKFGADPGDIFMVRNVANLVPPYAPDRSLHGTSAALEFAVGVLKVEHVIVMGHAKCGGIGALLQQPAAGVDFVKAWMTIAWQAREKALAVAEGDTMDVQRRCELEAVKVSLKNLHTFPWVEERVAAGQLTLHGWYFDLETGLLHALGEDGEFRPVT